MVAQADQSPTPAMGSGDARPSSSPVSSRTTRETTPSVRSTLGMVPLGRWPLACPPTLARIGALHVAHIAVGHGTILSLKNAVTPLPVGVSSGFERSLSSRRSNQSDLITREPVVGPGSPRRDPMHVTSLRSSFAAIVSASGLGPGAHPGRREQCAHARTNANATLLHSLSVVPHYLDICALERLAGMGCGDCGEPVDCPVPAERTVGPGRAETRAAITRPLCHYMHPYPQEEWQTGACPWRALGGAER